MRSIAYERRHPGASEVCSPILAYSIGNRGKMGSKTKKLGIEKIFFFKLFFSAPYSSPKGHPGDMRLNASVRDYKNLDLEGSFDLLALPQPELYAIYQRRDRTLCGEHPSPTPY